jgi:hypothetical protein
MKLSSESDLIIKGAKMYLTVLTLHNITRWLVVISAAAALVSAFSGWFGKKDWGKADERAGMFFTSFMDLQVLLGLILYFFLSDLTRPFFSNFGAGMANAATRFYLVEHILIMIIAMALAHVGRAQSKKAADSLGKFRRAAIWYTVSIVVVLMSIPWPFMANVGRPLLRLFGLHS